MKKVHILPPEVVAKIAAGEVIERPASVLKELLENSIDAGSTNIEIHLKEAGKTEITIRDNGSGIAHDDMETIFFRHSTSKITKAEDLFDIHSLGFRGEALYSVAAVSDVILKSRTPETDSGWEIHMRGGTKLDLKPVALAQGTEISVKELFFNTPARRKFLKSNTTEMNQLLNLVIPYTLLYPQTRFLLTHADKTIIDLPATPGMVQRISAALNLPEENLLEVQHDFAKDDISIWAVLGDINLARSRRDLQFIFINNRPVQNKALSFHLNNVYRLIMPEGQAPFFALFIQMPAGDVDVNIHPTKREVKLKDEQSLATAVRAVCEQALMTSGSTKKMKLPDEIRDPKSGLAVFHKLAKDAGFEEKISPKTPSEEYTPPQQPKLSMPTSPTEQYSFPQSHFSLLSKSLVSQKPGSLKDRLSEGRLVGIFQQKYLLFESGTSLLLVDQHAAQERITFERFILQMEKGQVEVQNLLTPDILDLSVQEMLVWDESQEYLEKVGFSSTQFDKHAIAIHSYPVLLTDPTLAVRELLAGGSLARADHETVARRACRASIMAGDRLTDQEAIHMRAELTSCRDPFTCPHGRPTVVEMTESFLNKQFLRT